MADLPNGLTQAEVDEYAKLDAGIKKLQERHRVLNEKIKDAHATKKAGSYVYGEVIVSIQDKTRFDADMAEASLPYTNVSNRKFYKHVIDPRALDADVRAGFSVTAPRALSVKKEGK